MTDIDAIRILMATLKVNKGANDVEVSAEFGLDSENVPMCHVYIFGTRYTGESREIIEDMATYDKKLTIDEIVSRIRKYAKEEKDDTV